MTRKSVPDDAKSSGPSELQIQTSCHQPSFRVFQVRAVRFPGSLQILSLLFA